jgi:hypothetical protein
VTERSSDIEFDFFEEPETQEATPRTRPSRGGPRRPVRPPTGFTPLLRLAGLIAFAIVIVVLLVLWIGSCRSESKRELYRDYMADMNRVADDSAQIGARFNQLLTTPGIRQADLQEELRGLAERQEQGLTDASDIDAPGVLREEHRDALEALAFRRSGLSRLQDAFGQLAGSQNATAAGQLLAAQTQRLLASDVIWDDLFREPSVEELRRRDVTDVQVPDSNFLRNQDIATARLMADIFRRISGAARGGTPAGRHGHGLVSVKALPGGKVLSTEADENVITATADLAFEVTIENSGEFQEVGVRVRLVIQQSPQPIERTTTVDLIPAGERKTVVFRNLAQVQITQRIPLRVEVERVPGETNLANNSATYQVLFTLTPP